MTRRGPGPRRWALRNWAATGRGEEDSGFSRAGDTRIQTPAGVAA